jgi:ribosome-binding protein aMBF1 (putative translation factor)
VSRVIVSQSYEPNSAATSFAFLLLVHGTADNYPAWILKEDTTDTKSGVGDCSFSSGFFSQERGSMSDWARFRDAKLARDPEARHEYDRLGPQYEVISDALRARLDRGWSQEELAQRMGRQQPAISRFEGASVIPSIAFLQDLAEALDLKLSVRLVPKDDPGAPAEPERPVKVGRRARQKVSSTGDAR